MVHKDNRTKFYLLITGTVVIFFIVLVYLPFLASYLDSNEWVHPILAFILWNIPLLIALYVVFYSVFGKRHLNEITVGLWLFYLVMDYAEPPLVLRPDGTMMAVAGGKASIDYTFASIIKSISGDAFLLSQPFQGVSWLYILTYFVVPIILLGIAVYILPVRVLKEEWRGYKNGKRHRK